MLKILLKKQDFRASQYISDIHFRGSKNPIDDRIPNILRAVENHAARSDFVFLIFSGDLTFSGQESEMLSAMDFIEELRKSLLQDPRIGLEILLVPGNHDCDLSVETAVRKNLVNNIIVKGISSSIDDEVVENCTVVQQKFFQLRNCFENETNILKRNKLLTLHSFLIENKRILFNCLNLAWLSTKEEKLGGVIIPYDYFPSDTNALDSDIFICLMTLVNTSLLCARDGFPLSFLDQ